MKLDPLDRVIAAAASHHRLAWIHPFPDGNGRVARLFSHAYLARIGVGAHGLWTMSRGLGRQRERYFDALASADSPRRGDLDGRGNPSDAALARFCETFLDVALDQISFMSSLLELDTLERRVRAWSKRRAEEGELRPQAAAVPGRRRRVGTSMTRSDASTLDQSERALRQTGSTFDGGWDHSLTLREITRGLQLRVSADRVVTGLIVNVETLALPADDGPLLGPDADVTAVTRFLLEHEVPVRIDERWTFALQVSLRAGVDTQLLFDLENGVFERILVGWSSSA